MPNWCHNRMEITGPSDDITRFKQTCIHVVLEGEQARLDFNAIKPEPYFADSEGDPQSGRPKWYEWRCKHWGTKWNACDFHVTCDEPDRYECYFDTAWSPPVPIWEALGEMFPTLEFSLGGIEPLMDFAFEGKIQDGKLDLQDKPVVWSTVDRKTGKTISGTRAEVERLLDEPVNDVPF